MSLMNAKKSATTLQAVGSDYGPVSSASGGTQTIGTGSKEDINEGRDRRTSNLSGFGGPGFLEYAGVEDEPEETNALHNESSSVIRFYPEWCQCMECLRRHRDGYHNNETLLDRIRSSLLCPPQGPCARAFSFCLMFILAWLFIWLIMAELGPLDSKNESDINQSPASPKGPIFALGLLEILGLFAGIFSKCCSLPSLLGPLILGIFLRNVGPLNIFKNLEGWDNRDCSSSDEHCLEAANKDASDWIKPIRLIALTMILTRAGLELSPKQLKKLKGVVPLLAFGPCIVEACACAFFTYAFFNWAVSGDNKIGIFMCFVSGFALAAVSPAVVVPGMLSLKKKGLGVGQGIPTLLIAASSIDDVLAISLYTVFLGIAVVHPVNNPEQIHSTTSIIANMTNFNTTNFNMTNFNTTNFNMTNFNTTYITTLRPIISTTLNPRIQADNESWKSYASGPISLAVGCIHGIIVGMFLHFIPARDNKSKAETRLILLLLLNLVAIFAYERDELVQGAGSLATLVTSFIASFGWRSQPHWKRAMKKIEMRLAHLWTLCVPLLFGTIGKEIDFLKFQGIVVVKILAIIFFCLFIRCCTAFLIVGMVKLNWKERLFCALSWIPKATVQAALAPLVMTKIQEKDPTNKSLRFHGQIVVTTAVLAILITAPLGSVLIAFFAKRLLRTATEEDRMTIELEFPNGDGLDPAEVDTLQDSPSRIFVNTSISGRASTSTDVVSTNKDKDKEKDTEPAGNPTNAQEPTQSGDKGKKIKPYFPFL